MTNHFPDIEWNLADDKGGIATWEMVGIAVLMDIRRELRALNAVLRCPNFQSIPSTLRTIRRNTHRRRKAVKS